MPRAACNHIFSSEWIYGDVFEDRISCFLFSVISVPFGLLLSAFCFAYQRFPRVRRSGGLCRLCCTGGQISCLTAYTAARTWS
jgi:hypothetical protein